MANPHDLAEEAVRAVDLLRRAIQNNRTHRVRSKEERSLVRATCYAWFSQIRKSLLIWQLDNDVAQLDVLFQSLLEDSERQTSRAALLADLANLRQQLIRFRSNTLTASLKPAPRSELESPPNFSPLVPDLAMRSILESRWNETGLCISVGANLAATVMIGGLLEGLLLARLNLMGDKAPAFKAKSAPKDDQGKTLPLKDWTLKNFIEVGHELGWIGEPARDVGSVLRDYRNFIHPAKQLSYGIHLTPQDTEMLWSIFVTLSKQLIASAAGPRVP